MEELKRKWDEILHRVKKEQNINDIQFNTWFKPLKVYTVQDGCAYLLVNREQMGLSYITKKYALSLKEAITEVTGMEYDIKFILQEQTEEVSDIPAEKMSQEAMTEKENFSLNPNDTSDSYMEQSQIILETTAEQFGISVNQMMVTSRNNKDVVCARQIAMYLCRTIADLPMDSIGQLFGGREHSIVSYGIGTVYKNMHNDYFRQMVEIIRRKIEQKLQEQ